MPENTNLIDILSRRTGQDAREYSQGYDSFAGIPSVGRQVNEVQKRKEAPMFTTYTPQEQANFRGMDDYSYGQPIYTAERPSNLKESDRDDTWISYNDAVHTEDRRARQQSGVEQLINGIGKGAFIAATTFVDGIVGTAAGIVNLAYQAANGDIERPADALFAFIDNPISRNLQKVNEWAEKVMPNYYTEEQRNAHWYEPVNLFSANFVGDKFLKNTGFMIGAAYSGRVNAGMMSKAVAKRSARNAFKGVVKNSAGKDLTAGAEIYRAYKTGDAFMDGVKLTEDLGKAAKQLRNEEWGLKLLGAMTAAAGEARIEAITNTQDYEKRLQAMIDNDAEDARGRVQNEIIARSTPENPTYTISYDPETGKSQIQYTQLGQNLANEMLGEIEQRRQDASIKLQQDKAVMANQIFGLNLFILTGTDLFTFGRFIAGGYATNRGAKEYSKRAANGLYKEQMKERNKSIAKAAAVPFVEGPYEEMMQASAATGAGYHASAKMNRFYGYKLDPEAESDAVNSVNAILEGIRDTYTDADRWEEGLIGAMSSILGIPGFVESRNENGQIEYEEYKDKNGRTRYKPKQKFRWQGEFIENIRDARENAKKSKELTEKLNEIVKDPEFVSKWQAYIRHKSLDRIKDEALTNGDIFAYKNADSDQIISDIQTFDKAGRIQDLFDLIDENENIKESDADAIRAATKDTKTNSSPYDDVSDADVVAKVKEHAGKFRDKLKKYIDIKNDIKQVYGTNMDEDYLEAMTWAYMTIDDAEDRMKSITGELIPQLNDIFHVYSALTGEEIGTNVDNLRDLYRFMFNGKARDKFMKAIRSTSARNLDADKLLSFIEEMLKQKDEILDVMENTEGLSDSEIKQVHLAYESALDSYMEAMRLLEKVDSDETLHSISDMEMNKVRQQMVDLANLIAYKTEFLDMLATLSNNPGAFSKDVVQFQKDRMEERNKQEAQKLYDSIDENMSQKDFNDIIFNKVKNARQNELLRNMLKSSNNNGIKALYKEFQAFESAMDTLSKVSRIDENDPNGDMKGMFNSIFMDKVQNDTPGTRADILSYIDETAKAIDTDAGYEYANFLKSKINVAEARRQTAENSVKETNPEKQSLVIEEEPEPSKKEKKDKESETKPTLFDDSGEVREEYGGTQSPAIDTGDAADGKSDPNESLRIAESVIEKLPANELQNIIDGVKVPEALEKVDKEIVLLLAQTYLDKKNGELGGDLSLKDQKDLNDAVDKIDKGGMPEDESKSPSAPKVYVGTDGVVLNGLGVTGFDTGALIKEGIVKQFEGIEIAKTMREEFNVFNFLDSGGLTAIEEFYITEKKSTTPIKFVFVNKNEGRKYTEFHSYFENGGKTRDRYNILLAVEITPEIVNALNQQQKDQLRTVEIDGKQYQMIGVLKRMGDSEADYTAYMQIYNINIESIDEQRENNPEQDLFIGNYRGEPTSTTINKIYPGRRPKARQSVNIKDILGTALGGPVYFGVAVRSQKDGTIDIKANTPDNISRREPSDIGINIVPGMVFAFVPTPDGSYSYVPVLMARTNEMTFKDDPEQDTDFVKDLKAAVDILLDANAQPLSKMQAKASIMRMINIGRTQFYFRFDEPTSFKFDGKKITSFKEFVDVIKNKSFRVQFDRKFIDNDKYIKQMIDAGVMSVNYSSLRSYNSSFTVNALGSNNQAVEPKRKRVGQVRNKFKVTSEMRVLMVDKKEYVYTSDGIVDVETGVPVTDKNVILRYQIEYIDKFGENPFGLTVIKEESKHRVLYEIPPDIDGAHGSIYFARLGSALLARVPSDNAAKIIRELIEKENKIEAAKEAEKESNGLVIVEEDGTKTPAKPQPLTPEDAKPKPGDDATMPVEEAKEEPPKQAPKRRGSNGPARRQAAQPVANLGAPTEKDNELAKRIKDEKLTSAQIATYFRNHGVNIQVAGLGSTALAQVVNKTLRENPELNVDQMVSEIKCGRHGK